MQRLFLKKKLKNNIKTIEESDFIATWSPFQKKKSYSGLKDPHLNEYFKLSVIRKNLKTVKKNTRYENRDRNTISLRNSIDKKIQSIKEERKRTIEKRKSIQISKSMSLSIRKSFYIPRIPQQIRKQTKFFTKKSLNMHLNSENKFEIVKISHNQYQKFLDKLIKKHTRKCFFVQSSKDYYYDEVQRKLFPKNVLKSQQLKNFIIQKRDVTHRRRI